MLWAPVRHLPRAGLPLASACLTRSRAGASARTCRQLPNACHGLALFAGSYERRDTADVKCVVLLFWLAAWFFYDNMPSSRAWHPLLADKPGRSSCVCQLALGDLCNLPSALQGIVVKVPRRVSLMCGVPQCDSVAVLARLACKACNCGRPTQYTHIVPSTLNACRICGSSCLQDCYTSMYNRIF